MEMDIPMTLLYIFLAFLQIYILYSVGIIATYKKLMTPKSTKTLSEMIVNYFLPIYAMMELSKMSSWENVEIMWILIVSTLFAVMLCYFVSKLIYWAFRLDERMVNSFSYLASMPSLGTCPLVLGRALCYPGGMLEGDPLCNNILGYMMTNFLIFEIVLFSVGFSLMPRDANFNNVFMEKISYLWHILIPKVYNKNYAVNYIFKKFIKDDKRSEELFNTFEKKYKLVFSEENSTYTYTEDESILLDFNIPFGDPIEMKLDTLKNMKQMENEKSLEKEKVSSYFENKIGDSLFNREDLNLKVEVNEEPNELNDQKESKTSEPAINKEIIPTKIEIITEDIVPKNTLFRQSGKNKMEFNKTEFTHINEPVGDASLPDDFEFSKMKFNIILDIEPQAVKKLSFKEEMNEINAIMRKRIYSIKMYKTDIEIYYNKVFSFVEAHLNESKLDEYETYKLEVFKNIFSIPPKFPTARYVALTRDMLTQINEEWEKFETNIKKIKEGFELTSQRVPVSFSMILNKIYSPPIIGCFLGLLIGMSGMREILFSKNHYVSNLVEGIYTMGKPVVPLVYAALGITMMSVRNINFMNTPFTKKYIMVTFLVRFVVLPGLGLFYVYLWAKYFGGIVASSKVFRFSVFIPFCLPSSATAAVIVNIVNYFKEETALILFTQNTTTAVTLTIWYLIYYVVIG